MILFKVGLFPFILSLNLAGFNALFIDVRLRCNSLAKDCCIEEGMPETRKAYEGLCSKTASRSVCNDSLDFIRWLTLTQAPLRDILPDPTMPTEPEQRETGRVRTPLDPETGYKPTRLPAIYTDLGGALLGTSILSTSNCGNPALRLFGFGPTVAEGSGIGYIVKEDGVSLYASNLFSSLLPLCLI